MPYATPLTEPEIAAALASLPEWRRDGDWLIRTVVCPTVRASIALVAAVADAAEEADHHPDIEISWRRVTFRLTTKAARALTAKDVAMAATINRLASITA
jgi:4a-hydroxytetrahydrobiopterin dehydratase